ncbi:type VI secretion system baseplate subunit TssE [Phyllobacterium leguminum]|uniref:Type VI secretion system protein n=1 Tax=Phyllobacterium leguminum TaxID=314237 RepID=A0A318T4P4_9HYPH|nr:type VI secretion system baseplate subunit TssE [Phyllobacterium leguminum]PYE85284.1 type VI secretion system protein [Phyllobacterium leguminum]
MASGRSGNSKAGKSSAIWDSRSRVAAGSLFDRLLLDEEELEVSPSADATDSLLRSIQRNLERILNTHAGGAAANPQVGVTDFNDGTISSNDVSKHITASIDYCIRTFEPRIGDVRVEHAPDPSQPLQLRFTIVASIKVASTNEQIRIDMAMRDGRFHQIG